ncbi:PREDICTED: spermatogenesis-associated protein 19, mitochondrial [Gekko japonicus]|uniref:Spermatogenesis-associated protein 19, mitochondrial n=1 Tax=Gekko japonicus TaxID=146911 RepID=A0ABM1JI43_GEKJA|nr:PREDICTED: spermatogenesis-associated protein 19, mitochondrial [Gekko japonicus]
MGASVEETNLQGVTGQSINVIETEAASVLEHWLQKIEQEATKLFKQKPENKTESKKETKNEIQAFPSVGQDLAAARSKPESWENFEDRRPPRRIVHESRTKLTSSSSQDLAEDRTRIQFIRWSHTRVYRVTSDNRKDAMEERVDKVRKSVSRVMFQVEDTQSEPDIQIKDSE